MSRLALILLPLLVAACTGRPGAPETPEYFTKVTGVPLCSGAIVRNVDADAPRRFPEFDRLYMAEVSMPAQCEAPFLEAAAQRIGASCNPSSGCSGNSSNGDFYRIERLEGGFRVTHST